MYWAGNHWVILGGKDCPWQMHHPCLTPYAAKVHLLSPHLYGECFSSISLAVQLTGWQQLSLQSQQQPVAPADSLCCLSLWWVSKCPQTVNVVNTSHSCPPNLVSLTFMCSFWSLCLVRNQLIPVTVLGQLSRYSFLQMHSLQNIISITFKVLRSAEILNPNSLLSFVSEMEPVSGRNPIPRSYSLSPWQLEGNLYSFIELPPCWK